jgi:hypothetical protein
MHDMKDPNVALLDPINDDVTASRNTTKPPPEIVTWAAELRVLT